MSDSLGAVIRPGHPLPGPVATALGGLAGLHDAFDQAGWLRPGKSKGSCVLSALTARDYLWRVGIRDAQVVPVYGMVRQFDLKTMEEIWSVGVGDHKAIGQVPPGPDTRYGWNGHLIVVIPSAKTLVDPCAAQLQRPHWEGVIPDILVLPLKVEKHPPPGVAKMLTCATSTSDAWTMFITYLEQRHNVGWRDAPDAQRSRRLPVVKQLADQLRRRNHA